MIHVVLEKRHITCSMSFSSRRHFKKVVLLPLFGETCCLFARSLYCTDLEPKIPSILIIEIVRLSVTRWVIGLDLVSLLVMYRTKSL
jgi:hypothetical protein